MTEAIQKKQPTTTAEGIERVLIMGDLAALKPEERLTYYKAVCESVGLNPLTKPLDYIVLNNKLTLYANRSCTDQLRKINSVSVERLETQYLETVYVVTAYGKDKTGRLDTATGAVPVIYPDKYKDREGKWVAHPRAGKTLIGEELANALMKAETKAKRRLTLSICGLGLLDESEIDSVPPMDTVEPEPEPNMVVRCSQCGSENGHADDCPTRQPKPTAAPKATKAKAEPKAEPEAPKQAEGKVIEPEKGKNMRGWLYVEDAKDMKTKKGAAYQVWSAVTRNNENCSLNVFHKTLHANSGLCKGNWAECEVSAKASASDPSRTLYTLEAVHAVEDQNGITTWKDNSPMPDPDVSDHGVPVEEVFGDTP